MQRLILGFSLLVTIPLTTNPAFAQEEPKKKVEAEPFPPAPKAIPAEPMLMPQRQIFIEPYYQRTDTRDVWQNYGLNSGGRFVPRVINTPYGYSYSRDLQPYPWAGSRPRAFVP